MESQGVRQDWAVFTNKAIGVKVNPVKAEGANAWRKLKNDSKDPREDNWWVVFLFFFVDINPTLSVITFFFK